MGIDLEDNIPNVTNQSKYKARATAEERSTVGRKPAKCDDKRTNLRDSKDSSLQNNVVRRIFRQSCEATNRNAIEAADILR